MQFAALIPAWVGFHLVGRFVYHSVPAWIPGCTIGLAIAAGMWIYYCFGSGYPTLWALGTLSVSTILWFSFLVGVFRAVFILDHHDAVATSDIIVVLVCASVVIWLRHVLSLRNKVADHLVSRHKA